MLNIALEDVLFAFVKIKEEEMVLADQDGLLVGKPTRKPPAAALDGAAHRPDV